MFQTHAASQEALDQIRAANEASLRSQLEQKIRELEAELGRARNSQQDSLTQRDSTRSELERFKQLHSEELRLRKSLSAKLERFGRKHSLHANPEFFSVWVKTPQITLWNSGKSSYNPSNFPVIFEVLLCCF